VFDPGTIRAALALTASQRAKPDDVLDALVALWSAGRISREEAESFPLAAEYDRYGLRMQILA
jgi:predicted RNase H-like nuclease